MEAEVLLAKGRPFVILQVRAGTPRNASTICSKSLSRAQNGRERVEINLLVCSIKPLVADTDRRFTFEITTPSQGCTKFFSPSSSSSSRKNDRS